jgi:hypothetical protein
VILRNDHLIGNPLLGAGAVHHIKNPKSRLPDRMSVIHPIATVKAEVPHFRFVATRRHR